MKTPKISIVMVDGLFREKFHAVDFFSDQTLPPEEYELLWAEYYDRVNPELQAKIDKYPNARVITLNREGEYHSSYCFNGGIAAAQGELLVIPDADVVVERDFLARVWEEHQTCDKLVLYVHRHNEDLADHKEDWDLDHLRRVCRLTNLANYGSCLTVRKKWLDTINGYEQHETFRTHFHGNGYDVYSRLKTLGLHVMWHPELKAYHPWHPITSVPSLDYEINHAVSDYRARKMQSLSYQGIQSDKDTVVPDELLRQIEQIRQQGLSPASPQPPPRKITLFMRIRYKLKLLLKRV